MAKKQTKKELESKAREIAKTYGVKIVYANPNGEFFTEKCNAVNSVDDPKKIMKFDCSNINMEDDEDGETESN